MPSIYGMVCPKCGGPATILHAVDIPSPLRRTGRVQFKPDGTPDIPLIPNLAGECLAGHKFAGPVEDYIEPTVEAFMKAVEKWSAGPSASSPSPSLENPGSAE